MALKLYIDVARSVPVTGISNNVRASIPPLYVGDRLPVELHFLRPTGLLDPFYAYADYSAAPSMRLAVGVVGQTPVALADDWEALAPAGIEVVDLVKGGGGADEVQRVSLSPLPLGGSFRLSFSSSTTAPIAFDAAPDAVKAALEALASIGAGNVEVSQSAAGTWDIAFGGTLANTDVALITGDASGLIVPIGSAGVLELDTEQAAALVEATGRASVIVELEVEDESGSRSTLVHEPANLLDDLIDSSLHCLGCDSCESCEACDECQRCDACQLCDACDQCDACQRCDQCQLCDSCDQCDVCQRCDACQVGCDTCDGYCDSDCGACQTSCQYCDNECGACQSACQACDTCQACDSDCGSCQTCDGGG